jgi:hypothetical protein
MKQSLLYTTALMVLGVAAGYSQTKTGTTVGQFLLIEPSARISAMGNAGVTATGEVQATYYNPASLGYLSGSGIQVTHSAWIADITYDYVGGVLALGDLGNLFGSVTSLNSGDIEVRTIDQPLGTGERYTVSDVAFGLGYGRRISDRFTLGLQMTYLQETIWHSSMSAVAINIGTLYQISQDGLRIGASISNWGTRATFDGRDLRVLYDQNPDLHGQNPGLPAQLHLDDFPLPILFRVGLGYPITIDEDNKLMLALDALHPSDNTESVNVGVEWLFFNTFALRGGYQNYRFTPHTDSEVGLTLGAGVQYGMDDFRLFVDYGWADQGRLQKSQRLTLGILF